MKCTECGAEQREFKGGDIVWSTLTGDYGVVVNFSIGQMLIKQYGAPNQNEVRFIGLNDGSSYTQNRKYLSIVKSTIDPHGAE